MSDKVFKCKKCNFPARIVGNSAKPPKKCPRCGRKNEFEFFLDFKDYKQLIEAEQRRKYEASKTGVPRD